MWKVTVPWKQHSAASIQQKPPQKPLTTKDTKDTEKNQDLPRMDADERGLGSVIKPVEWRPIPDMYRTDTPEGREAYAASLRMKMAPQPGAEWPMHGVAQPGAAVPHEHR